MMPSSERMCEIDDKYELYSTLDEWAWLHEVLLCIYKECSPWMHAKQVHYLYKKIFVQVVDETPIMAEELEPFVVLT